MRNVCRSSDEKKSKAVKLDMKPQKICYYSPSRIIYTLNVETQGTIKINKVLQNTSQGKKKKTRDYKIFY